MSLLGLNWEIKHFYATEIDRGEMNFSLENAYFPMRFRLSSTLQRTYLKTLSRVDTFGKRSPIVLVWTAKTEAFENADVIHTALTPIQSICVYQCRMRRWLRFRAYSVWTGKTLRKR